MDAQMKKYLIYEGTPRKKLNRKVPVHCSEECRPSEKEKK